MTKVFLSCSRPDSTWRDEVKPLLKVRYVEPFTSDKENALRRDSCDFVLHCVTPKTSGMKELADVVNDSFRHPNRTIVCVLREDGGEVFDSSQMEDALGVLRMAEANGAAGFVSLQGAAGHINRLAGTAKIDRAGKELLTGLVEEAKSPQASPPTGTERAWLRGRITGALEALNEVGCAADFTEAEETVGALDAASKEHNKETQVDEAERERLYVAATQKWGIHLQSAVFMGECGELIAELCRVYAQERPRVDNLLEEMADVFIMTQQFLHHLDKHAEFEGMVDKKLGLVDEKLNRLSKELGIAAHGPLLKEHLFVRITASGSAPSTLLNQARELVPLPGTVHKAVPEECGTVNVRGYTFPEGDYVRQRAVRADVVRDGDFVLISPVSHSQEHAWRPEGTVLEVIDVVHDDAIVADYVVRRGAIAANTHAVACRDLLVLEDDV